MSPKKDSHQAGDVANAFPPGIQKLGRTAFLTFVLILSTDTVPQQYAAANLPNAGLPAPSKALLIPRAVGGRVCIFSA